MVTLEEARKGAAEKFVLDSHGVVRSRRAIAAELAGARS
jgi:hypothetical protein